MTEYEQLLEQWLGPDRLRPRKPTEHGGEWDQWRALSVRERRALAGAGYVMSGGLHPDELADRMNLPVCEAVERYVELARRDLAERRRRRHSEIYRRRDERARRAGFPSHWYHRLWKAAPE